MVSARSTSIVIRNMLLLLLTCIAGYLDAISYRGLERVFTANMTGNTVLLGLALVEADSQAALWSGLALAGFLMGSALGAWIVERGQSAGMWPPPVTVALALEWVILLAFAVGWQWASQALSILTARAVLIVLSALAMGVQSATVRRLDVSGIATTYITGTLTHCVIQLVGRVHHGSAPIPTRTREGARQPGQPQQSAYSAGLLATVWVVYIGGAAGAAVAPLLGQMLALVVPLVLLLIVIGTAAVTFWPR